MTQTPEQPITKLEQIEAALGKLAELTFQNATRHDTEIKELIALSKQTTENINNLASEAAQDRQQAAIDRTEFRQQIEQRQSEIRQIWEYLRSGNGESSPPQT